MFPSFGVLHKTGAIRSPEEISQVEDAFLIAQHTHNSDYNVKTEIKLSLARISIAVQVGKPEFTATTVVNTTEWIGERNSGRKLDQHSPAEKRGSSN